MRQRVRGPSTLFVACVLLSGAAQALAGNGTSAPSEPATAKPVIPTPAAVVPAKPAEPDAGQALSVAEKAALAKQRMERCRLHPGTCEQGAKNVAKHVKDKSKTTEQADAPERADQ